MAVYGEISLKQRRILDFITSYQGEYGYPPTLREVCKQFKISSTNGARYHLHRLRDAGYVEVSRYTSRGVRLVGDTKPSSKSVKGSFRLPLLGRVPAGRTDYAAPDLREGDIVIDPDFFGRRGVNSLFGLRVRGDSMTGAGIHDGDVVVVKPQEDADDGEIVVARVEDEATVKRIKRKPKKLILQPENPVYEPIVFHEGGVQDVGILGIVVGLIRSM